MSANLLFVLRTLSCARLNPTFQGHAGRCSEITCCSCCREHSVCELHQQWVADGLPLLLDGRFVDGAGIVLALLQVLFLRDAFCKSFCTTR